MTLLVFSALLAAVATFWVIQPIFARRSAMLRDVAPGGVLDAEARKRVALTALKELEYDYLGGKLDQSDYEALRQQLSVEALQAIRSAELAGISVAQREALRDERCCGFVNPPGSRFCGGCGVRLS